MKQQDKLLEESSLEKQNATQTNTDEKDLNGQQNNNKTLQLSADQILARRIKLGTSILANKELEKGWQLYFQRRNKENGTTKKE